MEDQDVMFSIDKNEPRRYQGHKETFCVGEYLCAPELRTETQLRPYSFIRIYFLKITLSATTPEFLKMLQNS